MIAQIAMALGILLLVPIDNLYLYAAACIVAGVPMATVIATQSLIVSRLTPRPRLAESFTWSTTCLLVGVSAGVAVGGLLAEHFEAGWLLATAGASTALSAALAGTCLNPDERQVT